MHLKLDELIWAARSARNSLIDLEEMSENELCKLVKEFRKLRTAKPASSSRCSSWVSASGGGESPRDHSAWQPIGGWKVPAVAIDETMEGGGGDSEV